MLEIELLGKPNHWSFTKARIRIGRDSTCDVGLSPDEFPVVSREHAVLEIQGDRLILSDLQSANGTYINGLRVTTSAAKSGDIIRLGTNGPELRLLLRQAAFQKAASAAASASEAPTRIAGSGAAVGFAATVVRPQAGAGDVATTVQPQPDQRTVPPPANANASSAPAAVRVGLGDTSTPPAVPGTAASQLPQVSTTDGEKQMLERKLNGIRNLLAANLIVLVILLFGLFYEGQQINRNRETLFEMRKQAQTAVGQFTPALDARLDAFENRLSAFEKRADGLDGKIQQAEDRFILRLDQEMPVVMDKYINRKMEEMRRQSGILQR